MAKPTDNYWIGWRTYDSKQGGYCTHATETEADRALCGVVTTDGAGQTLTQTNGLVGCVRCQKALRKRGVIPPQQSH